MLCYIFLRVLGSGVLGSGVLGLGLLDPEVLGMR